MTYAVIQKDIQIIGEGNTPTEAMEQAVDFLNLNVIEELEKQLTPNKDAMMGNIFLTDDYDIIKNYT
jgi:hypothetical protein